jgi:hypothetical protein
MDIMKKNKLLIPILAVAALFPVQGKSAPEKLDISQITSDHNINHFPKIVSDFKGLDFDKRLELREYLLQKKGLLYPYELIDPYIKDSNHEFREECSDIIYLGRWLSKEDLDTNNVGQIAKICGFNRLSEFYEFKKNKKNVKKNFLENKDPFYASALCEEMLEFKGISSRLDLWDFLFLNRNLMKENWRYQIKHPGFQKIYKNQLNQKIKTRILMEQKRQSNRG